jgi:thiamine transport system permease protein
MKRAPTLALAALPLAFLFALLVAPALRLAGEGWAGVNGAVLAELLSDDYVQWRVLWSVLQAASSCALVALLGVPMAWVLARYEFAGRSWVLRGLMLPFIMPTLLAAIGVLSLLGPRGLAQQWWGMDAQGTPWLLLYGNVFFNLCVVLRAGLDGFAQVSSAQVAAARTLGASPWRVFWRLEWPTAKPWVMSSLCVVALYCFSGFGLALVLGGQHYATLEVEIFTLVAHELKLPQASVLALLSAVLSGTLAWAYTRSAARLSRGAPSDALRLSSVTQPAQQAQVFAALALLGICCAAPLLAIVWRAGGAVSEGAGAVLFEADTWAAVWNTVRFSVMALGLATLMGVLHALATRRWQGLRWAMWLPFVVSPITIAFGVLLLYPFASATLPLLIAAYALLAYPFFAVAVMDALDALPPQVLHAASSLGASPWRVFWRVELPLMAPALRRGMAFAAASCVGEFAVSLFLSRPEWTTLTTLIYQTLSRPGAANLDAALVLACLLMVMSLATFTAIDVDASRSPSARRRGDLSKNNDG